MKKIKLLFSLLLVFVLLLGAGTSLAAAENSGEEAKPLMRIAFFSDMHVEFGLQDLKNPIRPSIEKAVDSINEWTDGDGVDLLIVGGDMTGPRGGWTQEQISDVKTRIHQTLSLATKDDGVLYVAGNHDPEPSVKYGQNDGEDYSADYSDFMEDWGGEPVAALYSDEIDEDLSPFNEQLCYRYTVKGIEFIGINTPWLKDQGKAQGFYAEQMYWVCDQLDRIGPDKTVFLFSHYPTGAVNTLSDSATLANQNVCKEYLRDLLKDYPKIIYCYGHWHNGESFWAKSRTAELVKTDKLAFAGKNLYRTSSYIDLHMGSMWYYDTPYQPNIAGTEDSLAVQYVSAELYADRIVFQVHNCGEKPAYGGKWEISPLAISRDIAGQMGISLPGEDGSDGTDSSGAGTVQTDASPTASDGGSAGDTGMLLPVILLVVLGAVLVAALAVLIFVMRKKPSSQEKDG